MIEPVYLAVVDVEEFDDTELGSVVRDARARGVRMVMLQESNVAMARLRPDDSDELL